MFGLLGTLIPLGPGLIALGQGDTYTLSQSMLTAFDTTIAGLAAAAVSFVISTIRKRWYEDYMTSTEALAQCILEKLKGGTTCGQPEVGVAAAPEKG
jgi:biopolymer transport protein ExbB/TolQ